MCDEDRRKFIESNLEELTSSTVIEPEFVVSLLENGLINDTEKHLLLNENTPNLKKGIKLYTETANKWDEKQFFVFKDILQKTGNLRALKVFEITTEKKLASGSRKEPNHQLLAHTCNRGHSAPAKIYVDKNAGVNGGNIRFGDSFRKMKKPTFEDNKHENVIEASEKEGISLVTNMKRSTISKDNLTINTNSHVMANASKRVYLNEENLPANDSTRMGPFGLRGIAGSNKSNQKAGSSSQASSVSERKILQPSEMMKLIAKAQELNLSMFTRDVEVACELLENFSHDEVYLLISNNDTRFTDVLMNEPGNVLVALGEMFVPPKQLVEFRGRFCKEEEKGVTVFEMGGCEFAVEYLWSDLVGEMEREEYAGTLTVALKESLGKMGKASWDILRFLEKEVNVRRTLSSSNEKVEETLYVRVMKWVTQWLQLEDQLGCTNCFLGDLPIVFSYCKNIFPSALSEFLQEQKEQLEDSYCLMKVLQSLIVISSLHPNDHNTSDHFCTLTSFLRENLFEIPSEWRLVVEVFVGATREQIKSAASSAYLVRDVCVGGVFINLFSQQSTRSTGIREVPWEAIVRDVIEFASSSDLPAILQQLENIHVYNLDFLKVVLKSEYVELGWENRFCSKSRREGEISDVWGLSHLLSFYFTIFGPNLDWIQYGAFMIRPITIFQDMLPVEISVALRNNPRWIRLLPKFQEILRESCRKKKIDCVFEVLQVFSYKSEAEWETFLTLINGATLLLKPPPVATDNSSRSIPSTVAAPFIRSLIKLYGVEWTSARIKHLWGLIPSNVKYRSSFVYEGWLVFCVAFTKHLKYEEGGSVNSLGSLLHSAVILGELEEVKRRAFPGLLSWRNKEDERSLTALELAISMYDSLHPIRVHLQNLTLKLCQ